MPMTVGVEPTRDQGAVIVIDAVAEDERMSQADHRVDVVRRLLDAGLSVATLRAMLPEFVPVIDKLIGSASVDDQQRLAGARQ